MGEAWFNTQERMMYIELEQPNAIEEMAPIDLWDLLFEIASGTKCFGHLDEWDEWFRYLLPDFIERRAETLYFDTTIFQSVVTAFMVIYWKGIDEHYEGFRDDVLSSLSVVMMDGRFWSLDETRPRPIFLDLADDGAGRLKLFWDSETSDPSVSAALFFLLKYLRPDEMSAWIESVVSIEHPLWQGNLMVWFLGVFEHVKSGTILPDDIESSRPELEWEASHLLGTYKEANAARYDRFNFDDEFLEEGNLRIFFDRMIEYYSEERILELAVMFAKNEHLSMSTFNVPELLQRNIYS